MSTEHETECATCYHGASMHRFVKDDGNLREECVAEGCDCDEFVDSEEAP